MKTHRTQQHHEKQTGETIVAIILIAILIGWMLVVSGCCTQHTDATLADGTHIECQSTTFFKDISVKYDKVEIAGTSSSPIDAFLAGVAVVVGLFI